MIVPLPRSLKLGDKGADVLMVKRAISIAGYRRWGFGFTQGFGKLLQKNVAQFQKDHGLDPDGEYGPETHKKLAPYFDAFGAKTMLSLMPTIPVRVQAALVAYNNARLLRYSQDVRMQIVRFKLRPLDRLRSWLQAGKQLWEDCSSSSTGYFYIEGLPDPNGYDPGYPGLGFTGTLSVHGKRVATPKIGDLGFYGAGWPYHHTVMCVGFKNGVPRVVSFGSDPGPFLLPYNYRSDFSHWRTYT